MTVNLLINFISTFRCATLHKYNWYQYRVRPFFHWCECWIFNFKLLEAFNLSTKVYTCFTLLLVPIRQPPPCRPMSALYRGYNFFATGQYHILHIKKDFFPSHHKFLSKQFIYLKDNLKDQFIPKSSSNFHPQSALVKFKNGKENLKFLTIFQQ